MGSFRTNPLGHRAIVRDSWSGDRPRFQITVSHEPHGDQQTEIGDSLAAGDEDTFCKENVVSLTLITRSFIVCNISRRLASVSVLSTTAECT